MRLGHNPCGKVTGVFRRWRRGNEGTCGWISVCSSELKLACIIDGKVQWPLKWREGVLGGRWVWAWVWMSKSLWGHQGVGGLQQCSWGCRKRAETSLHTLTAAIEPARLVHYIRRRCVFGCFALHLISNNLMMSMKCWVRHLTSTPPLLCFPFLSFPVKMLLSYCHYSGKCESLFYAVQHCSATGASYIFSDSRISNGWCLEY